MSAKVTAAHHHSRKARVRNYVLILVERAARAALDNPKA
ncbi:three-helix bundle dimerization domain-containing protein [Streptomyces sp. NPDC001276]